MDVKFLQHRLNQLHSRTDIGMSPGHLPKLVEQLATFEERGLDFEHGLVVLDRSGDLRLDNNCPVVAHEGEHLHDGETFLNPFFYKKNEILVWPWARQQVEQVLAEEGKPCEVAYESDRRRDEAIVMRVEDAGEAVPLILEKVPERRRTERTGRVEEPASYNYLFFASPIDCGSPAGDPVETADRPHLGAPGAGQGVTVAVLDTGILPDYASNPVLADDIVFDDADIDLTYSRGYIHFPGCHGTFAAGVVRRVAPACTILAVKVLDQFGIGSEADVARGIRRAVKAGVDIINLSLTCPGVPADVSPVHLEPAIAAAVDAGISLVGAAGNAGRPEPTWPGHLADVVGVGAVDVNGARAHFSNYGDAIDIWARGEDVVGAFGTGPYRPLRGGPTLNFAGYARWSGTSFATPLVSGLIAARQASDGTKPLEAQQAVLDDAVRSLALGPGPDGEGARLVTLDTNVSYPPSPPGPTPGP